MNEKKILTRGLFVLLTSLYLPVTFACEQANDVESENLLSISQNNKVTHNDTESYEFKKEDCQHADHANNKINFNSYATQEKPSTNTHYYSQIVAR